MGVDRIAGEDDIFDISVQVVFTAGTENHELKAAVSGYVLRVIEADLQVRTNTLGAASTITFKRGTTAIRGIPTVDGRQVSWRPRPRGWCETATDLEALQINASVALTTLSGHVTVQRIPV